MDLRALFLGTYLGTLVIVLVFGMQFIGNLFAYNRWLAIGATSLAGILYGGYLHRFLLVPLVSRLSRIEPGKSLASQKISTRSFMAGIGLGILWPMLTIAALHAQEMFRLAPLYLALFFFAGFGLGLYFLALPWFRRTWPGARMAEVGLTRSADASAHAEPIEASTHSAK